MEESAVGVQVLELRVSCVTTEGRGGVGRVRVRAQVA